MPATADDILLKSGGFGRFQVRIVILLGILVFPSAFITYMPMFILTIPKHRCAIDDFGNDTYAVQSPAHLAMRNASIPWDDAEGAFSSCYRYSSQPELNGSKQRVECSNHVFDKTFFLNSFIEKFGLVCDKKHWRSTANSMMMIGKTVAALVLGPFSDRFGRRTSILAVVVMTVAVSVSSAFSTNIPSLLVSRLCFHLEKFGRRMSILAAVVLTVVVSVSSAFPTNIPSLLVSRFWAGLVTTSIYLASYITALEYMCPQHRSKFLVAWGVLWMFGGLMLTGVGYFVRDSQHLILTVSVPWVLLLSYYWLIPESPRWFLSKKKIKRARKAFEHVSVKNGKEFPSELFDEVAAMVTGDKRAFIKGSASSDDVVVEGKEIKENLLSLLRYKKMAFIFAILIFNWLANSLTYYALMFNVSNLPGSVYTNFMLLNCVDLVSNFLSYVVLDRFGRKWSYAGFLLLATLGCLLCTIPVFVEGSHSVAIFNGLALLGRAGISASYNIIYLYSAELLPTSVRCTCLGIFNTTSKIGSMFSPYIADLGVLIGGHFKEVLPMMVCGGIALTALVLSLFLPETVGKDLPTTVADSLRVNKIAVSGKLDRKGSQSQSLVKMDSSTNTA